MFSACSQNMSSLSVVKKEKAVAFELKANNVFDCTIVDLDKCYFKNGDFKRADWLFLVPKTKEKNNQLTLTKSTAYFVELKGVGIEDASKQLYNAIINIKSKISTYEIKAKVVSVKGIQPNIRTSTFYRKVRTLLGKDIEFHKVHKGNNFIHIENI